MVLSGIGFATPANNAKALALATWLEQNGWGELLPRSKGWRRGHPRAAAVVTRPGQA
jgi:hypothetical protein